MRWLLLLVTGILPQRAEAYDTFEDWAYYTGDPHVHSGLSGDGGSSDYGTCKGTCGSFYTIFEDGRAAGLDWMAVSDHTNGDGGSPTSDSAGYDILTAMALDNHDPEGGFVTLPAAEVWARVDTFDFIGHVTVLMFGENEELEGLGESDLQPSGGTAILVDSCEAYGAWFEGLVGAYGKALMIPHHPAATRPMPYNWDCHFGEFQPAVEVYSEHGQSLTDDSSGFDPMWSGAVSTGTVQYAMDPDGLALQMGFMGGSDSHDTRPGKICQRDTVHVGHPYGGGHTIAVMDSSETFDRSSLYDAIKNHHTYATTGPTVPLMIEYSTGGVIVAELGDPVGVPTDQSLDVEVRIPEEWLDYIVEITLVTPDGTVAMSSYDDGVWSYSFDFDDLPYYLYAAVEFDGKSYYGFGKCDDGGPDQTEWLWVSPSWVTIVDPDLDNDGVSWADGDCDDGDDNIGPLADEIWYDGVDQNCDGSDDDQDSDGYALADDCDDADPDVSPGTDETWYDGVDQDCDGNDDDQDEDGFARGEDCDDTEAGVNPDEDEVWYDGADQDCDGNDDDQDQDGYGLSEDCDDDDEGVHPDQPEVWYDGTDQDCDGNDDDQDQDGYSLDEDCNDLDEFVNPGADEVWYDGIDQDCDARDDDQDGDGYRLADDCDDSDDAVNPGVAETWYDGIDQDCDGRDDDQDGDGYRLADDCDDTEADAHPSGVEVWYDDVDQDCDGNDDDQDQDGFDLGEDCDDTADDINPGMGEVWYDGTDQDCDGNDDDQDQDGYLLEDDCDDADASVSPGAAEIWYDGTDQNCDGGDDDQDEDGYLLADDCDDTDDGVSPASTEICADGIDQDCDGADSICEHGTGRIDTSSDAPGHGKTDVEEEEAEEEEAEEDVGTEETDTGAFPTVPDELVRPDYLSEDGEALPGTDAGERADEEVDERGERWWSPDEGAPLYRPGELERVPWSREPSARPAAPRADELDTTGPADAAAEPDESQACSGCASSTGNPGAAALTLLAVAGLARRRRPRSG